MISNNIASEFQSRASMKLEVVDSNFLYTKTEREIKSQAYSLSFDEIKSALEK